MESPIKTSKRIVLLGNGIDKAHNLKTGYLDFLKYYILKHIKYLSEDNPKKMKRNIFFSLSATRGIDTVKTNFDNNLFDNIKLNNDKELISDLDKLGVTIRFKQNKNLLVKTLEKDHPDWGNVENCYISIIEGIINYFKITIHNHTAPSIKSNIVVAIQDVNRQLEVLREELFLYLKNEIEGKNTGNIRQLERYIFEKTENINDIVLVNFNYTNTLNYLLQKRENKDKHRLSPDINPEPPYFNIDLISIHGSIAEGLESIIFGYGNEDHEIYSALKNNNPYETIKNFKTVWYSKYNKYQKLLKHLNTEHYEVYSFGLSFSSSDKTLIKTIITNDNCKKFKLFYRPENNNDRDKEKARQLNYVNSFINLLLTIDNDVMAREKIINFQDSSPCPQLL